MEHYIDIARLYFERVEGMGLYPSVFSKKFILWLLTLVLWFGSIAVFFVEWGCWGFYTLWLVVVSEVAWLLSGDEIKKWKNNQIIKIVNEFSEYRCERISDCKKKILEEVLDVKPSGFYLVAKEIRDLLEIKNKFRMRSDLEFSEIGRRVYDKDSKARLITLIIALFSMIIALSMKSDAALDSVFYMYLTTDGQKFIVMVGFLGVSVFMLVFGLRILALNVFDLFALWGAKFSHAVFVDWVVGYLVRDLVAYYVPSVEGD